MESKGTTVVASSIHQALTDSYRYTTLRDTTHNQLAQLPADELMFIVEQLVLDSEHLGEENLANLASLLGSSHMEVEVRKE